MHDLHLADQILKTVLGVAQKNNLKKINSISVELGDFIEHGEKITPENLKYNFSLLSKNTIANDAKLIIFPATGQEWKLKEVEGD